MTKEVYYKNVNYISNYMGKQRMVNTKFWVDNYVSNLDPIEKLLFLYFLTNPATNICGIYELPVKNIAVDTGIEQDMVLRVLKRFSRDNKMNYIDGWVCMKNFISNQNQNSHTVITGIQRALDEIPDKIRNELIGYGYPIDTLSYLTKPNLTKPNLKDTLKPFDDFWKKYPNKVAKKKAYQSWLRISPDEKLSKLIMQGLEKAKKSAQWTKDGGTFIPHPTTWLNQERWNDEGSSVPIKKSDVI